MAGVDGDLVGGAGAVDVPLLDEQLAEGERGPRGLVRVTTIRDDLEEVLGAVQFALPSHKQPHLEQ